MRLVIPPPTWVLGDCKHAHRSVRSGFSSLLSLFYVTGQQGKAPAIIDVSQPGMVKGVQNSKCFLLVLTEKVFTRPFCRLEILTAIEAKKPFITVNETDERFHKFEFSAATSGVPASFHPIVDRICRDVCAIPIRRDKREQEVMVDKIMDAYLSGLGKCIECSPEELAAAKRDLEEEAKPAAAPAVALGTTEKPNVVEVPHTILD